MDYGVSTALGLQLNCFLLEANCSYGLTPIGPFHQRIDISKIYNRTLALTVGYWFGK